MVIRMVRDNKEVKPLLLKLGIALALSFAGFLYSQLRSKKMRYLPSPLRSTGGNKFNLHTKFCIERGLRALQTTAASRNAAIFAPQNYEKASQERVSLDNSVLEFSPSNEHSEDEDGLVYPELDEPPKEFKFSSTNTDTDGHMVVKKTTEKETNQEIINLRNMVQVLREREMKLEIKLLEYYGLKEQEAAVMELENRLKINNVEAKFFTLKIESLQADKQRMEAQVTDYTKVKTQLESAKSKIKLLKRKIKSHAEQSKERISALQEKVKALQDQERKNSTNNTDIQSKLQRLKDLEVEAAEFRTANSLLQCQNSELASRLTSIELRAPDVVEVSEVDALQEANNHLRLENDNLSKDIEQVQADRCADVEELVYLRWVNACLRYELRNQQIPPGKTVARDLNKTLSPRSEAKAKQLVLEYANLEGLGNKGVSLMDIDSDYWSSTRNSPFTDSADCYDSLTEHTTSTRTTSSTKSKFYSKLKRLVRRRDDDHSTTSESPRKRESVSTSSLEDMVVTQCDTPNRSSTMSKTTSKGSDGKSNEQISRNSSLSHSSSRKSLDVKRARNLSLDDVRLAESDRRRSDVGYFKMTPLKEGEDDIGLSSDRDTPERLKLMKFAAALKDSHGTPNSERKSMSFTSY